MSYYPFKDRKCLAWDYTCPNSLGPTHIKVSTSKEASKAASLIEVGKLKKYKHLNKDYQVILVGIWVHMVPILKLHQRYWLNNYGYQQRKKIHFLSNAGDRYGYSKGV